MNRRSFVSRVAVFTAAVPVLKALELPALDGGATSTLSVPASMPMRAVVETVTQPTPGGRDLLTLRHERGLLKPCPNCAGSSWTRHDRLTLACAGCGWLDDERALLLPCPCWHCTQRSEYRRHGDGEKELAEIELQNLLITAPVGVYFLSDGGRSIRRTLLNERDVCSDRWNHHVQQRRIGRVSCAIYLGEHGDKSIGAPDVDRSFQPNGNRVVQGWYTVDCLEWQQERARGERT